MPDNLEQFREKDKAYFDLLGRTVAIGNRLGTITEYRPVAGPEYWFTIWFGDGNQIVVPRDRFFVLPSPNEVIDALEAVWLAKAESKVVASPREHCVDLAKVVGELLTGERL